MVLADEKKQQSQSGAGGASSSKPAASGGAASSSLSSGEGLKASATLELLVEGGNDGPPQMTLIQRLNARRQDKQHLDQLNARRQRLNAQKDKEDLLSGSSGGASEGSLPRADVVKRPEGTDGPSVDGLPAGENKRRKLDDGTSTADSSGAAGAGASAGVIFSEEGKRRELDDGTSAADNNGAAAAGAPGAVVGGTERTPPADERTGAANNTSTPASLLAQHEKTCEKIHARCFFSFLGCGWEGLRGELHEHLKKNHRPRCTRCGPKAKSDAAKSRARLRWCTSGADTEDHCVGCSRELVPEVEDVWACLVCAGAECRGCVLRRPLLDIVHPKDIDKNGHISDEEWSGGEEEAGKGPVGEGFAAGGGPAHPRPDESPESSSEESASDDDRSSSSGDVEYDAFVRPEESDESDSSSDGGGAAPGAGPQGAGAGPQGAGPQAGNSAPFSHLQPALSEIDLQNLPPGVAFALVSDGESSDSDGADGAVVGGGPASTAGV